MGGNYLFINVQTHTMLSVITMQFCVVFILDGKHTVIAGGGRLLCLWEKMSCIMKKQALS